MHKINLIISCLVLGSVGSSFAQLSPLTVEKIMRDPKWMGTSPSNYRWSDNSRFLYFNWNPEGKDKSQVYRLDVASKKYELSSDSLRSEERRVGKEWG